MAEATTVTHHPLPLGHHQRKKMMRAPHKGRANVWPHVHELTEAYYEAHSDVGYSAHEQRVHGIHAGEL